MPRTYMTPEEFARERARREMTQEQMADLLGCHINTVQNYEAGRTRIPKTVAVILRQKQY